MLKLTSILSLIVFVSCSGLQTQKESPSLLQESQRDKMVFLVFKITKSHNHQANKVTLIQESKSKGNVKINMGNTPSTINYLTIICYGKASLQKTFTLPHPLYKQVEYLNDSNQYSLKDVELEEDTFFVRLPYNPKIQKISIFETLGENPKKDLITLNL